MERRAQAGAPCARPMGLRWTPSGNLYVADQDNSRVLEYNTPFAACGAFPCVGGSANLVFGQGGSFTSSDVRQRRQPEREQPVRPVRGCAGRQRKPLRRRQRQQPCARIRQSAGAWRRHPREARFRRRYHRRYWCSGGQLYFNRVQFRHRRIWQLPAQTTCVIPRGSRSTAAATSTSPTRPTTACSNTTPRFRPTPPPIKCSGKAATSLRARCNNGGRNREQPVLPPGLLWTPAATSTSPTRQQPCARIQHPAHDRHHRRSGVWAGWQLHVTSTCNLGGLNASALCSPCGVAVDPSGNLYIADSNNNRVLKYNTPLTTDTTADLVFGQGNFSHDDANFIDALGLFRSWLGGD